MNRKLLSSLLALPLALGFVISGCSDQKSTENVDLNALKLEELVEKAKADGEVQSVGMPDSWANWDETWADIAAAYGLKHADVDMSSAEEFAIFEAEKNNATKDIGDVGQSFGPLGISKGLSKPYKTSYWESIPEWAKDKDGHWIIAYYGTISMLVNADIVGSVPRSFEDILNGDYMVSVGDVASATQSHNTLLSVARAYGGDEKNIAPGLDFFRKLAEQGRLDLGEMTPTRMEKGEIAVSFLWDYNALNYRDQFLSNNPKANFEVHIPREAAVQSGYTTIINAYSKRPYAAALTREFILSDEGQINLAKGYAKPIRDVKLPADLAEKLIDPAEYANAAMIKDMTAWDNTAKTLGQLWQEEVLAYVK